LVLILPSTTNKEYIVPMPGTFQLINSLAEEAKYMIKGGKRSMRQDSKENKMYLIYEIKIKNLSIN